MQHKYDYNICCYSNSWLFVIFYILLIYICIYILLNILSGLSNELKCFQNIGFPFIFNLANKYGVNKLNWDLEIKIY